MLVKAVDGDKETAGYAGSKSLKGWKENHQEKKFLLERW